MLQPISHCRVDSDLLDFSSLSFLLTYVLYGVYLLISFSFCNLCLCLHMLVEICGKEKRLVPSHHKSTSIFIVNRKLQLKKAKSHSM